MYMYVYIYIYLCVCVCVCVCRCMGKGRLAVRLHESLVVDVLQISHCDMAVLTNFK